MTPPAVSDKDPSQERDRVDLVGARLGRAVLVAVVVAFVAIAVPVVWRGALLGDDFHNCVEPSELGLPRFFAASWQFMGIVRLARFTEILLTAGVCKTLPFGVAILVPLILTLAVAFNTRGLLRDTGVPRPWADLGGAMWLLQPLGTETGLWPAALHVPLGLLLALIALRSYCRGRFWLGALATIGAVLSVEQVILGLPVAAWFVVPSERRRQAVVITTVLVISAVIVFAVGRGADPRLRVGVFERFAALTKDPAFYAGYPAVGLGLHSIPLAIRWAFPWSVVVLAAGGLAGALVIKPMLGSGQFSERSAGTVAAAALIVAFLVNVPVALNVPHYGSPRLFAPTWLVLAVSAPLLVSRARWRRPLLLGTAAGLFAAGAVLSLAFSVWVRLVSADVSERMARAISARVADGAQVAVCGVRRTVVTPAPRGAFSLHEFVYEWSARDALAYYTGRRATFQLAGELWGRTCPAAASVDAVIRFDEFLPQPVR